MFLLQQLLWAAGVAFALAAVLCALAALCRSEPLRRAAATVAVALGYLSGHLFTTGWTSLPPTDTTNWLPWFALTVAVIGSFAAAFNSHALRGGLIAMMSIVALRLLLAPKFLYGWSALEGWIWVICVSVAVVALSTCLSVISQRVSRRAELPVIIAIVSAGTSIALILSGSFVLGQFAAVLAGATLGSLVLALRRQATADMIEPVFSLLLISLLVSGYFFAEVPAISAVLLAAAPACALVPNVVRSPRWAVVIRIAIIVAMAGSAVFAAFRSSPSWSAHAY